ncbi:MAG: nickel transporter, partial [Actinobacteria bacterium]|nr:nickel transporter [Actinomycetota bacterium]
MEIVPVLDLLGGVVVHGRAGRRHEYRPVQGVLVEGSEPVAVASALQRVAAAAALYVADLDAIEGTGDNLAALRSVMASVRAALWVDAGVTTAAAARDLLTTGVSRAVVGTETLPSVERWEALRRDIGDERLLLSLDMRGGVVRSAAPELRGSAPLDALRRLDASTLPALLVLPVDRVGSSG